MRIFLTGASGYLGSLLAERLAEQPEVESITGIGMMNSKSKWPSKVEFIAMDIRSPEVHAAMAGHDAVVHTACIVLWPARMPESERDDINYNGLRNVASAAAANRVGRFIHASSMAAYDPDLARGRTGVTEEFPLGKGHSPFYYWNAKADAEKILAEILERTTLLTLFRPIYIIGPRNRATVKSYRRNAVNFFGCNPKRQFIHEEDVAAAFIQAVRTDLPGAYNLVPDDFMYLNQVWEAVGKRFVPRVPAGLASWITGVRWRYFGSPIHPSWVEDMLVDFAGSNEKLKQTGWRPHYSSAEALRSACI